MMQTYMIYLQHVCHVNSDLCDINYNGEYEYIAGGRVLASEALTSVKLMQTRPGHLS